METILPVGLIIIMTEGICFLFLVTFCNPFSIWISRMFKIIIITIGIFFLCGVISYISCKKEENNKHQTLIQKNDTIYFKLKNNGDTTYFIKQKK